MFDAKSLCSENVLQIRFQSDFLDFIQFQLYSRTLPSPLTGSLSQWNRWSQLKIRVNKNGIFNENWLNCQKLYEQCQRLVGDSKISLLRVLRWRCHFPRNWHQLQYLLYWFPRSIQCSVLWLSKVHNWFKSARLLLLFRARRVNGSRVLSSLHSKYMNSQFG